MTSAIHPLRALLLAALPVLALALPATAGAHRYDVRIGLGDQNVEMFADRDFQRMKLRQVRYFIHWNVIHDREQRLKARRWVQGARAQGLRPLLHVSTDDLSEKKGALPSVGHYRKDVGRLVRYFRKLGVRDFGAWNEANHKSQPTWNKPRTAARYFKEMRRALFKTCSSSCRVIGLDVLDQRGVERYIGSFMAELGRSYRSRYLRVVGIHNYSDVNRLRTTGIRNVIDTVHRYTRRPNFWLTETGGVVKFGRSFPCSEERAANRLSYLFRTARNYRRHLQRVYLYNFYGGDCKIRFDAGLMNSHGEPREGYRTVRRWMRHFKR